MYNIKNVEVRKTLYVWMLKIANKERGLWNTLFDNLRFGYNYTTNGFCWMINLSNEKGKNIYVDDIEELIELYSLKPKTYGFPYWFECNYWGWRKRRNLLKKAIKECDRKIKNGEVI